MGIHANITASTFPRQSDLVGKRVKVCFHHDDSRQFEGVVLRDDLEEPFKAIFHLDDGRTVLSSECHYQPA